LGALGKRDKLPLRGNLGSAICAESVPKKKKNKGSCPIKNKVCQHVGGNVHARVEKEGGCTDKRGGNAGTSLGEKKVWGGKRVDLITSLGGSCNKPKMMTTTSWRAKICGTDERQKPHAVRNCRKMQRPYGLKKFCKTEPGGLSFKPKNQWIMVGPKDKNVKGARTATKRGSNGLGGEKHRMTGKKRSFRELSEAL